MVCVLALKLFRRKRLFPKSLPFLLTIIREALIEYYKPTNANSSSFSTRDELSDNFFLSLTE